MIGFTHAAVGGFIGSFLPLPLALPVAFASHFVLDMLPHYGIPHGKRDRHFWRIFTMLDFVIGFGYLAVWTGLMHHHYAALLCGLVAISPDLIWVARIIRTRTFDLSKNTNWFTRFHAGIQRYERPWGIYIEVPLAISLGVAAYFYWIGGY